MRDRLIELIDQKQVYGIDQYQPESHNTYLLDNDELADHLLAEGVIVPPVKVGDVVFSKELYWENKSPIVPYQITNIHISQSKKGIWVKKCRAMKLVDGKTKDWALNFDFDGLGKTVFLTREEAEKALERRENGK